MKRLVREDWEKPDEPWDLLVYFNLALLLIVIVADILWRPA